MAHSEFGAALKQLRERDEMLLGELADEMEVAASMLSAIEHGKKSVPKELLKKLVTFFGMSEFEAKRLGHLAQFNRNSHTVISSSEAGSELVACVSRALPKMDKRQIRELQKSIEAMDLERINRKREHEKTENKGSKT